MSSGRRAEPGMTRRRLLAVGAGLAATAAGTGLLVSGRGEETGGGALERRVRTELETFTGWLGRHGVQGYVGEVGWPTDHRGEADAWNALGDAWYGAAEAADLWVTYWSAGEWWPPGYPLAAYRAAADGGSVAVADSQASVLERHRSTAGRLRGVSVAGGSFGAPAIAAVSSFSNRRPGLAGHQYRYPGDATFAYLADRGHALVRLDFRWERLQPALWGPLDAAELDRLRATVRAAARRGLRAVLDMHNYGGYYLDDGARGVLTAVGSPGLPAEALAQAWTSIVHAFAGEEGVAGFGIMNEPVLASGAPGGGGGPWERTSALVVQAIRAVDGRRVLLVPGAGYSGVQQWTTTHARPWIPASHGPVRYEAHHYWDRDHSSRYRDSFRSLEAALASPGPSPRARRCSNPWCSSSSPA